MGSRTPHGVRGLKFVFQRRDLQLPVSHPTRGAWIEILRRDNHVAAVGAHPTRGAWIEINCKASSKESKTVAPHTGCVD